MYIKINKKKYIFIKRQYQIKLHRFIMFIQIIQWSLISKLPFFIRNYKTLPRQAHGIFLSYNHLQNFTSIRSPKYCFILDYFNACNNIPHANKIEVIDRYFFKCQTFYVIFRRCFTEFIKLYGPLKGRPFNMRVQRIWYYFILFLYALKLLMATNLR